MKEMSEKKKKKSGIPTGNAGEYFVMGELLRRGYDAQLADRNTKGYDILVGKWDSDHLKKVQVKTVRSQPWYVKTTQYNGPLRNHVTIFVLLGDFSGTKPVRYFITINKKVAKHLHYPKNWKNHAFMPLKAIIDYENRWDIISKWLDS